LSACSTWIVFLGAKTVPSRCLSRRAPQTAAKIWAFQMMKLSRESFSETD
jgi:hypothetical protein